MYISCVVSNFHGTEFDIWAGFGPIGSTEKKVWADYEQLLRTVFSCFRVQKKCNSRVSNIESNDSQNVGLEVYKDILLESFHILVLPL